jgi:hypothetical protein
VKNQRIESAISPKDFRHYFPLLYMPADRPGAVKLLENPNSLMEKFNVVICLEDAVRVADRKEAARRVIRWLPSLPPSARRGLFIRPAGDEMFSPVLFYPRPPWFPLPRGAQFSREGHS